jgi:hypothetical protein
MKRLWHCLKIQILASSASPYLPVNPITANPEMAVVK